MRTWRADVFAFVLGALVLTGCGATAGRADDDLTTTTQVKIALLGDARVGAQRLDVSTRHGVVTLSGTVRTRADEQRAMALAKTIHGVRAVKSDLKVQE